MRFAALFFATLAFVSCASDDGAEVPDQLEGTVAEVVVEGHTVNSFDLETEDGEMHTIVIDADHDYGFDLLHLQEHAETGDPVAVELKNEGSQLVATSIEDV